MPLLELAVRVPGWPQNPNYAAKLKALGLNIDNFLRVLWRFLVKPSQATQDIVANVGARASAHA